MRKPNPGSMPWAAKDGPALLGPKNMAAEAFLLKKTKFFKASWPASTLAGSRFIRYQYTWPRLA